MSQPIIIESWTAQVLLTVWAILQSLILEYVPYASDWYGKLDKRWKRGVQALGLLLVSAGVYGLACADIIGGISCDQNGVILMSLTWIWALVANQTTHLIVKKDG